MKITDNTALLISKLEYIIGDSCYNPDSYNGWTGEYGSSFRYPVCYKAENADGNIYEGKTRLMLDNLSAKSISGAFYKFRLIIYA